SRYKPNLPKNLRINRGTLPLEEKAAMWENEEPPFLWKPGKILLEDFLLERVLGQGGMGRVYLAKSQSSGQRFAVKIAWDKRLGREENQRQSLDELTCWIDLPRHPHLVACYFLRTIEEQLAIFAEFVEGGSLASWIKNRALTRLDKILDVA